MKPDSTRIRRWPRPLALALAPLVIGCGRAGDGAPSPVQDAVNVSKVAKENYLKARAERKAQNPGASRAPGRR